MTNEKELMEQLMTESHNFAKKHGLVSSTNHNDAVDGFRHTYSSAYLVYKYGSLATKVEGNMHELLGQNPSNEKVMDYYNNQVGREIGERLKKDMKNLKFNSEDEIKQYLAFQVNSAIKEKKVITDLKDKRIEATLKNMPDHPLRVYTREDIDKMTSKEFEKNEKAIMKQMKEKGVPTNAEAQKAVTSGDMVHVQGYTRADGTEVKSHYRAKGH